MIQPFLEAEKERQVVADNAVKESQDRSKRQLQEQDGTDYESKSALAQRAYEAVVNNNPDLQEVFDAGIKSLGIAPPPKKVFIHFLGLLSWAY